MVRGNDLIAEAARLDKLYRAKARAELAVAEALLGGSTAVASRGDPLAGVVILKGEPSDADRVAGSAVAGTDAEAARKALDALGLDPESTFWACTRPAPAEAAVLAGRVEALVEAVDPRIVIALDGEAAADLGEAFHVSLNPGVALHVRGRRLLAVSGLEASLSDARAKARVWREFRALDERGRRTG